MTNPMITIHNCETDKVVTREMNAAEFKAYEAGQAANAAASLAEATAATAKAALLAKLGITADEAKLLIG